MAISILLNTSYRGTIRGYGCRQKRTKTRPKCAKNSIYCRFMRAIREERPAEMLTTSVSSNVKSKQINSSTKRSRHVVCDLTRACLLTDNVHKMREYNLILLWICAAADAHTNKHKHTHTHSHEPIQFSNNGSGSTSDSMTYCSRLCTNGYESP